jgi:hypothetical protein
MDEVMQEPQESEVDAIARIVMEPDDSEVKINFLAEFARYPRATKPGDWLTTRPKGHDPAGGPNPLLSEYIELEDDEIDKLADLPRSYDFGPIISVRSKMVAGQLGLSVQVQ